MRRSRPEDETVIAFRWLTVAPKNQKDLELVLMKIGSGPMMDDATAEQLRTMVKKGVLGGGVFAVEDCQKTYDDLSAKGVEFRYPPKDMPYGIETMMKDPFGNWFSVTQHG